MKWGTFIGIDYKNRVIKGANHTQMVMEEYMAATGITDPQNIRGPFETILLDRDFEHTKNLSDKELHMAALAEARKNVKNLVLELRAISERGPISLTEHCSRESGHPIGSKALTDYINRHYGHN